MVLTHGREIAPKVLAELGEYADWDDFAQATVGLSAEELQAEWQTYLVQRSDLGNYAVCSNNSNLPPQPFDARKAARYTRDGINSEHPSCPTISESK
jgi:hypothetical protein